MEMDIAAMSMSMAMTNTQNALAIGMLKKTMESSAASMDAITDMLESIPSPDGRGMIMDVHA